MEKAPPAPKTKRPSGRVRGWCHDKPIQEERPFGGRVGVRTSSAARRHAQGDSVSVRYCIHQSKVLCELL